MKSNNTIKRFIIHEIAWAVVVICATGFIIGSLYVPVWTWNNYWISLRVSFSFYVVMRFLMGTFAERVIRRFVPRTLERPKKFFAIEILIRVILGTVGSFLAFMLAEFITGINFLISLRMIYVQVFIAVILTLLVTVSFYSVAFYREMLNKMKIAQELREAAVEAELRALRAQVNPHFLFNTLNAIAALIASDPKRAEMMVQRLSEVFRYVLVASEKETVTLDEELTFLDNYLRIERVRFGEKLTICENVDATVRSVRVPGLILQPLVENAIKHGLASRRENGVLEISASRQDDFLMLRISDDGDGFSVDRNGKVILNREGIGVKNVRERIEKMYGGKGQLILTNRSQGGAVAEVRIPIRVS